jgi:hypothetical protein
VSGAQSASGEPSRSRRCGPRHCLDRHSGWR